MRDTGIVGCASRAIAATAGLGLLTVSLSGCAGGGPAEPRLIEGWAEPNVHGTAIGLRPDLTSAEEEGYVIAGAQWATGGGGWHDGSDSPSCVGTDPETSVHVELGVVTVKGPDSSIWDTVVWLRCLA